MLNDAEIDKEVVQATNALSKMVVNDSTRIPAIGRTFSVQYSLPKFPVPALEATLQKYLDTCRPLLTDEQYNTTEQIVKKFQANEGPKLQKLLEERSLNHTNWLSEWWKNVAYLDFREPVVINVSPGTYLPRQSYRGLKEQLEFSARLIAGVVDYKIMLDEQNIPVDTLGGKPLCMAQYYQVLGACRIPGLKKDTHEWTSPSDPNQPRHINVIHKNHIFSVDVFNSKGKPLSVKQLLDQLQDCLDRSQVAASPVGILTTMDRASWGQVYAQMVKDKINKASFENIHRSLFVLCLDGPNPKTEGSEIDGAFGVIVHGGGSHASSGNRWFDKTLQFITSPDGFVGSLYEHTTAEGPAVISVSDHAFAFMERNQEEWIGAADVQRPQRLSFNISNKIQDTINRAKGEMDSAADDVMIRFLQFEGFGKNFMKSQKLSPDGFIQVVFQLAYYRLNKRPCATYETGSLRQFQEGRTDTIRSCSIASKAFTQAMDDDAVPVSKKAELFRKAVQAHRKYTDEVVSGNGIDRHLLGLKLIALENGMNIPELFMDLAYKQSCHFNVSTSQVAAKTKSCLCFCPVVPDGYGLCYNPQDNEVLISISSFKSSPDTDSDRMRESLTSSFLDVQHILSSQVQSKL